MSGTRGSGKGGGHSKGQTMPYAVVWAWAVGPSGRTAKWTLGAAREDMRTMLLTANHREAELDVRIINRATCETLAEPQRCLVCKERWATEFSSTGDDYTLCAECDEDDLPASPVAEPASPATAAFTASLVRALRAKGLEPVAHEDSTVTVTANGIDWTLRPEPHAVTGEPCGVWSAVNPDGFSRGLFGAVNAAVFIAHRTTP